MIFNIGTRVRHHDTGEVRKVVDLFHSQITGAAQLRLDKPIRRKLWWNVRAYEVVANGAAARGKRKEK